MECQNLKKDGLTYQTRVSMNTALAECSNVSEVSDLHAADARYHRNCFAKLFTNRPSAESSTEACDSALEELLSQMSGFWNGIWSDLFIETTYMRCGHGPAGIVGSTLNESTLTIWALSHSTCAQLMNDLEVMKDGEEQKIVTSHKEERQTRIKADAAD